MTWDNVNLSDYIDTLESGRRAKGGAVDAGVPSLGAEHLNNDGGLNIDVAKLKFVPQEHYDKMRNGKLRKHDVLVVKDGATTGKAAYVDDCFPFDEAAINEHVFLLRTKKELDSKYLFLYLHSSMGKESILQDYRGSTIGGISRGFINMEIPLPPLSIQHHITDTLWKVKKLIITRREQIKVLEKLVQDTFVEMFGDTVINPKGWSSEKLEKHLTFLTSGSRGWAKYYSEEGAFFITIKNVRSGKVIRDSVQRVNAPHNKEAERTRVQEKDLLISITADLGRTAVVDEKTATEGAYINQHLSLLRLKLDEVVPEFLSAYLESPAGKRQFAEKDQVGVKSGLNFDALRSLRILLPPYELQREYAEIISKTELQKARLYASLSELEIMYKSALHKTLNGELFQ